jgi:uncharacterized membrane protein YphA (DoxX/SURF4 family)
MNDFPARKSPRIVAWIFQILVAALLGQAAFFKLAGAEASVRLFETLGVEPWGRYLTGGLETFAVLLLLCPRMAAAGGLLGVFLMLGAIGSHLGPLGIEVDGDGGTMFAMAIGVLVASIAVIVLRRPRLSVIRCASC